jgi:predicted Zn-dependent peptidase
LGDPGIRPFDFHMRDFRLPSGLRIVVQEDHRLPMVCVVTVVGVGSANDPEGKLGLAALLARMTFHARPAGRSTMRELLERVGGATFDASIALDETTFFELGPSSALPDLLRLEFARMVHPLIDVEESTAAIERRAARSELIERNERDPVAALLPRMQVGLFPSRDPYRHPPHGTVEGLANITLADLERLAKIHYRPDNMTMLIAGDVDLASVDKLLAANAPPALVGDPKRVEKTSPRISALARPSSQRSREPSRYEAPVTTPELWITWSLPGAMQDEGVLNDALGNALAEYLARPADEDSTISNQWLRDQQLRNRPSEARLPTQPPPDGVELGAPTRGGLEPSDPFTFLRSQDSASAQEDPDIAQTTIFTVPAARATMMICRVRLRAGTHPDRSFENIMNKVRKFWFRPALTIKQTRGATFHKDGTPVQITTWQSIDLPSKLNSILVGRSLTQAAAAMAMDTEDMLSRAIKTAKFIHFTGDAGFYSRSFQALSESETVTIERLARQYLERDRAHAVYITPGSAVTDLSGERAPDSSSATDAPGSEKSLRVPHSPDMIRAVARSFDLAGFRTVRLPNGVELVIGRRPGIPIVRVGLGLYGGKMSGVPLGVADVAEHVAQASHHFGHPSDFGANESRHVGEDMVIHELRSGASNVGKMLAIISEIAKTQTVDAGALDQFRRFTLPMLQAEERPPSVRAEAAFRKALYGEGHPYSRQASAADIAKVDEKAVRAWLGRTYRPDNAVIVVIGDIDPNEVETLARKWLSDWQSRDRLPQGSVEYVDDPRAWKIATPTPPHRETIVTDRAASPQTEIRLGCLLPETTEPRRGIAYELASEILTRDVDTLVRDRLGAGSGAHGKSNLLFGGVASLELSTVISSDRTADVLKAVRARTQDLAADGLSDDDLEQARWSLARKYQLRFGTTDSVLGAIVEARKRGWPLATIDRYAEDLLEVTPADLREVFTRCRETLVLSLLGDEQKARAAIEGNW